jgi:pyruvate dehydrogenase E1 component alpha subunit
MRARLLEDGIDAAELDAIDEAAKELVAAGEAEAKAAPEPSAEVLETQLWADGGSSWRSDRSSDGWLAGASPPSSEGPAR